MNSQTRCSFLFTGTTSVPRTKRKPYSNKAYHQCTTEDPLPPPVPLTPSLLPAPVNLTPHQFTLPDNTAGQSAVRSRAQQSIPPLQTVPPQTIQPMPHPSRFLYILPNQHPSSTPTPSPTPKVPYSTQSYRKKKLHEEKSSAVPTKWYKERTGPSTCSKCGKPRTGEHKQYYGNWYCPEMAQTYETWRQTFADKYKKKKNQ